MVSGESSLVSDEYGTPPSPPPGVMAGMWQATLFLGVLTLILGVIVSFEIIGGFILRHELRAAQRTHA